jgi:hypothetical protein
MSDEPSPIITLFQLFAVTHDKKLPNNKQIKNYTFLKSKHT